MQYIIGLLEHDHTTNHHYYYRLDLYQSHSKAIVSTKQLHVQKVA